MLQYFESMFPNLVDPVGAGMIVYTCAVSIGVLGAGLIDWAYESTAKMLRNSKDTRTQRTA